MEGLRMTLSNERRKILTCLGKVIACCWSAMFWPAGSAAATGNKKYLEDVMRLPAPKTKGTISVEQAIEHRRTVRSYTSKKLSLDKLAQLLWSAQGITGCRGFKRAAPSAGALYPMDVYLVAGQDGVDRVEAGVYHYAPGEHTLSRLIKNDVRDEVARSALSQMWMAGAPVNFVITAEYNRVGQKYGERGVRYAMMEAGHIGQNIFLQAEALGLRAGIVGAFHDTELNKLLNLPRAHEPLVIMTVGYPA